MKFERNIKREDGTKIKFEVSLYLDYIYPNRSEYIVGVRKCLKNKRTWILAKKEDYTQQELHEAKLAYWENIKPK